MGDIPEYLGEYDQVRLRGRLQQAMYTLSRENREESRRALKAVLEISTDHADTWLYLATLADTAQEQRECLEHVLASQPGHPVAMRVLAELDGAVPVSPAPPVRQIRLEEGQVPATRLVCPQCGGRLTYHEATREVTCASCGYRVVDADDLNRSDRHKTILEGNLRRKQQGKVWDIGERWLRCNTCGAITTLSRSTLTSTCRFCQSQHLVQESVHNTFEQPDLIVPFALDEREAQEAVNRHLHSGIRRLTRLFADAVVRIDLRGGYLPFWVFDADMIVNWSWTNALSHGQHPVLLSDVLFLAAPTPPEELAQKIEPYNLRSGVDYDPRLLAEFPAQLYGTDVPAASIEIRGRLVHLAQRKAEPGLQVNRPRGMYNDDDPGRLEMSAYTQFMTYRFALLPVWVGQLIEEDGDAIQVVVNGQTGKTALGKRKKPGGWQPA